ncbi:MAG: 1-deoxy-D-xylulose-5-phosphate reductoisomerase [Sumerlaeia bacterium]
MRALTILGSTGSIGTQALDVVRAFPSQFQVLALAAGSNLELFRRQIAEFQPAFVTLANRQGAEILASELAGTGTKLLSGPDALTRLAAEVPATMVLAATVGWTGVEPVLAAIAAGRDIALANKEVLVCAGDLVMAAAKAHGVAIYPVDSEHNAIMQCLAASGPGAAPLRRLILTCSGGAYRNASAEEIALAGWERTLDHPTWDMGRKITVDSATLMNKGFEVIEAHHLFGVPMEKIQVVIHPQSIVHSLVEFADGSMMAQMGRTDMRLPIQHILTYPDRRPTTLEPLDLTEVGCLDFLKPDLGRFPCLAMAYEAAQRGGTLPCVLNAANEIAVAAHLGGQIPCGGIPELIRQVLDAHEIQPAASLDTLREADRWGREAARAVLAGMNAAPRV